MTSLGNLFQGLTVMVKKFFSLPPEEPDCLHYNFLIGIRKQILDALISDAAVGFKINF